MTDFGRRAGDMKKEDYDADKDGVVDNAELLGGSSEAEVQDHTPKSHTHEEAEITDLSHNAVAIKGVEVDNTDIGTGKGLYFNGASEKLEYETPPAAGPPYAIRGDNTPGRVLRKIRLTIEDGTNADTIKATTVDRWNGDAIAATDNIGKGATVGDFTLTANGYQLRIEASGLTGNCVIAFAVLARNETETILTSLVAMVTNAITVSVYSQPLAGVQDLTLLLETGTLLFDILYLTDA